MPSSCSTLLLAMVLAPMLCTPAAADVYREDFTALNPGDALHGILLEGQEGQYEGAIENGAYVLRHHGDAGMVRYHFLTALPDQPERSLRDAGVSVVVSGDFATAENRTAGAGLVCAANSERRAHAVAGLFQRAGVVCEVSADPVGVEFAGCAKNAAALAAGATVKQGYNAAGMAAADIFDEVRALAATFGAKAETFLGRAGLGDLMATALTPSSRNRAAGELLADGVPAAEVPARLGQASEALETVSLLARAIERAGLDAPITAALAQLIAGELPLDRWVALVRAQQPAPARFRPRGFAAWWQRVRHRLRDWFGAPPRRPGLPEPRGYTDER